MTSSRLTYRFGPLERRGILGPVRLGQAAILGAGALLAVAVLDRAPSAGGALMALLAWWQSRPRPGRASRPSPGGPRRSGRRLRRHSRRGQ